MIWDDLKIEIKGFCPTENHQGTITTFANVIRDHSPSESFVKLSLQKTTEAFLGTVRIASKGQQFFIRTTQDSLQKTLKVLLKTLEAEMSDRSDFHQLGSSYV